MSVVFDYIYSLTLAAITAGVLSILAPAKGKTVGKVIKYPIALAVMLAVLAPVSEITNAVKNMDISGMVEAFDYHDGQYSYDGSALDYVIKNGRKDAEEKLADMFAAHFSLSQDDIDVTVNLTDDLTLESIDAVLGFGAFGVSLDDAEEYLNSICRCRVSVTYK